MNLAADMGAGLTGIGQLRAIMSRQTRSGIGETMQFDLVMVEDGRVAFESTPGLHVYNPIGMVHGGFAATLLDSVCGCAVHTKLSATQLYTTLELKVSYLKPITRDTGRMRAEGTVIQVGRRAAFSEGRLLDAAGKLYATATSSLLVMER